MIKQPNLWSCVPTSLANLLDLSLTKVIDIFGHDGSEIIYPDLPEPQNRRCFTEDELLVAAWKLGVFLLAVPEDNDNFLEVYNQFNGILTGEYDGVRTGHVVTKLNNALYDPRFLEPEEIFGFPYMTLKRKVIFAWIN